MNRIPVTTSPFTKYDTRGPRYTSYPPVPFWDTGRVDSNQWLSHLSQYYQTVKSKGVSLYIHLPFCERLCTFCGCHKRITRQHSVETPYIHALLAEWQLYIEALGEQPIVHDIHLGGGTPTFFSADNLKSLITEILSSSRQSPGFTASIEGHPNHTSQEQLAVLKTLGFNRVSFGIQDYDPNVQKAIHRQQSFEQVRRVHQWARSLEFSSISHDLVYGLPYQTKHSMIETIEKTLQLRPQRIALYGYAHVPWMKGVGQRAYSEADIPAGYEKWRLFEIACTLLSTAGYVNVGLDHFALPSDELAKSASAGKLYRSFMGYTPKRNPITIGLGASSISATPSYYAQNEKDIEQYAETVNSGRVPTIRRHKLTKLDRAVHRLIQSIMCDLEAQWDGDLNQQLGAEFLNNLRALDQDGLIHLVERQNRPVALRVTERGKPFLRNVCMAFDHRLNLQKTVSPDKPPSFSRTL